MQHAPAATIYINNARSKQGKLNNHSTLVEIFIACAAAEVAATIKFVG
jgi:hypothetical protein